MTVKTKGLTKAEKIKFLLWCGFKITKNKDKDSIWYESTVYTDPIQSLSLVIEPNIDITFLFRYAVPKLAGYDLSKNIDGHNACVSYKRKLSSVYKDKDPTQALYKAICEVIK